MRYVMVSGSRGWTDDVSIESAFMDWWINAGSPSTTLICGAARGADSLAADVATALGWHVEEHLPDWLRYGRGAGFIRNDAMLARNPEHVFIFWDGSSNGTRHVLEHCMRKDVPYTLTTKEVK